jgi:hypothetical protein
LREITIQSLSFLPEACKVTELAELFKQHKDRIAQFDNRQLLSVINNFINLSESNETTITCGLAFGQEFVVVSGGEVDPRKVVLSILLALSVLDEGQGIDPGMEMGNENALDISSAKNMTLLISQAKVVPAFDWQKLELSVDDQNIVSEWILEGRKKFSGKKKPGFIEI